MKTTLAFFMVFLIQLSFVSIENAKAHCKAHSTTKTVIIENAWATPNYGPNGAAYFTIKNNSAKEQHLIGAATPLATRVELHTHIQQDGLIKMRKIMDPIKIAPGETIIFEPGGKHVMMFEMTKKLKEGDHLDLTLKFKDGTEKQITAKISKASKKMDHRGSHH